MVNLTRELQNGPLRSDTIAGLAANFRLHIAYARATRLDERLTRLARREVGRKGANALLDTASQQMGQHHQTLDSFGLRMPLEQVSRDQHQQALNKILQGNAV